MKRTTPEFVAIPIVIVLLGARRRRAVTSDV